MNTEHTQKAQKTEQLTDAFRIFNELSEHLSISYQGLQDQVAKLHHELVAARDDRLKTLEEKEKLASRLEKILAALPAGVIVLDKAGTIVDCNAVALDFLAEPLHGLSWSEVVTRSLIALADNPHERQLHNGKRVNMTCRQLEQNAGQIILLSDVSEMRSLQDMVNQQKQLSAMGEMVASMAHQVRTPLATAILYASQMSNPALDSAKRERYSEKILERLHHLERQVNDMLIFAKEGRLAMEHFSLATLLARVGESLKEDVGQRQVVLQISNEVLDDELLGNENALRGALMNLLNNAVEAVGETGLIQLNAYQLDASRLRIVIQDDGPGIEQALAQRIFEPFFTTKLNGTGLGLAVVDSVVKAHGGDVQLLAWPDSGAVFALTLPCIKQQFTPLPGGFSGKNHHPVPNLDGVMT